MGCRGTRGSSADDFITVTQGLSKDFTSKDFEAPKDARTSTSFVRGSVWERTKTAIFEIEEDKKDNNGNDDNKNARRVIDHHIDLDDVSTEQAEFLYTPSDCFIVHPNHRALVSFDFVVLVLIIIDCVTMPLSLCFSMPLPATYHGVVLTFYVLDLIMGFTTGYHLLTENT